MTYCKIPKELWFKCIRIDDYRILYLNPTDPKILHLDIFNNKTAVEPITVEKALEILKQRGCCG